MKQKSWRMLSAAFMVIISLACFTITGPAAAPTPTSDYIFTPSTVVLKIEPASLPDGEVGAAYEAEIRVSDAVTPVNSMSASYGTLPPGLELEFPLEDPGDDRNRAMIRGIPEEAGTYTFTVSVSCFATMVSGQTGQREYVIVVK